MVVNIQIVDKTAWGGIMVIVIKKIGEIVRMMWQ
jgi:hypothetical protein